MKSSNLKAQENKHISLTNSKYINQNKYPQSKIKSNTRYISKRLIFRAIFWSKKEE